MGAKTPSSKLNENIGSLRLIVLPFANVDNGDTYTSNIKSIVACYFKTTTTTGAVGCYVSTALTGIITFACSADDQVGTLYILARG